MKTTITERFDDFKDTIKEYWEGDRAFYISLGILFIEFNLVVIRRKNKNSIDGIEKENS